MGTVFQTALRVAAVVLAFAGFTSCATLTKEECATSDWQTLGRSDGASGYALSRIDQHCSACDKHKLPVDATLWMSGWEEGIRLYCTRENGLVQGREGRTYYNSCPPELKADFEPAYFVAKRLHDARSSRDGLSSELDSLLRKLREAKTKEDRVNVGISIEKKRSELRSAEYRLTDAERDYDRFMFMSR